MKKLIALGLCTCMAAALLSGCDSANKYPNGKVYVYNWGEYIDPETLDMFEKETGITVKYEEYESPEEMYTKYKAGSINYDVICSSEYMVERLINEGEVLEED